MFELITPELVTSTELIAITAVFISAGMEWGAGTGGFFSFKPASLSRSIVECGSPYSNTSSRQANRSLNSKYLRKHDVFDTGYSKGSRYQQIDEMYRDLIGQDVSLLIK